MTFEVRAEKTSRNADDFKVLIVGTIIAIVILIGSLSVPRLSEQRWYRDITRLTPFYDVELLYSRVSEDQISISMGGLMVKRRCTFDIATGLQGYVYGQDGIRYRVNIDDSPEGFLKTSRPPSSVKETWGPWVLSLNTNSNIPNTMTPVRWEIIAPHVNCPTEPKTQRNLFIAGLWKNYEVVNNQALPEVDILIEETQE